MTSKQRVLTTFAHRPADRVPINYAANPGIDRRLKTHFGLAADDAEGLRRALGVDFRGVDTLQPEAKDIRQQRVEVHHTAPREQFWSLPPRSDGGVHRGLLHQHHRRRRTRSNPAASSSLAFTSGPRDRAIPHPTHRAVMQKQASVPDYSDYRMSYPRARIVL